MKQKIKILLSAIVAILVLVAISGLFVYYRNKNTGQTPVPVQKEAEIKASGTEIDQKEETITPLRLDYAINNFGPGGNGTMSYYIENKTTCDNRQAFLGLMKMQSNDKNLQPQYGKFSLFSDNGQIAVSQWNNETSLAFDDAKPTYNDLNLLLTLNGIFAYAGKNFNSKEYLETESPVLLKGVSTGRSVGDYSIIPQEFDNGGIVPCKKFKIAVKSTNTNGSFTACVAQNIGGIELPFIVSLAFDSQQGPSWKLVNFANEKSKIAWIPQCLAPVTCNYIAEPAATDNVACAAGGGRIETESDGQGCVKAYKCLTQTEIAKTMIQKMQNPECPVNQKVLDKYLQCQKNNKPNFDPAGYDDKGCLLDITNCR